MRGWLLVLLAGCGRLQFEPRQDAGASRPDITPIDVVPLDSSLPAGLIAWYPMDDTASNTSDVIGGVNGTCGTVQKCPVPTPGHHGGAFQFNASNDCIEIVDLGQLDLATYTVAIWTHQDAADSCAPFAKRVDVAGTTLDSWQIYTNDTNEIDLAMNDGSATLSKVVAPASTFVPGSWHHLAATVDGAKRILYYDGVNVGSSAWTTTNYDAHSLWIGCDDQGAGVWSQHYRGALDDLEIYNRALSPTEIMQLASQ